MALEVPKHRFCFRFGSQVGIRKRPSSAEEASWTNYQDDEVQVKDEISNMIMDALVNDTVQVLKRVMLSRQG